MPVTELRSRMGATSFTVWVTPEEVEKVNLAVGYGKVQIYLKTKYQCSDE